MVRTDDHLPEDRFAFDMAMEIQGSPVVFERNAASTDMHPNAHLNNRHRGFPSAIPTFDTKLAINFCIDLSCPSQIFVCADFIGHFQSSRLASRTPLTMLKMVILWLVRNSQPQALIYAETR